MIRPRCYYQGSSACCRASLTPTFQGTRLAPARQVRLQFGAGKSFSFWPNRHTSILTTFTLLFSFRPDSYNTKKSNRLTMLGGKPPFFEPNPQLLCRAGPCTLLWMRPWSVESQIQGQETEIDTSAQISSCDRDYPDRAVYSAMSKNTTRLPEDSADMTVMVTGTGGNSTRFK